MFLSLRDYFFLGLLTLFCIQYKMLRPARAKIREEFWKSNRPAPFHPPPKTEGVRPAGTPIGPSWAARDLISNFFRGISGELQCSKYPPWPRLVHNFFHLSDGRAQTSDGWGGGGVRVIFASSWQTKSLCPGTPNFYTSVKPRSFPS